MIAILSSWEIYIDGVGRFAGFWRIFHDGNDVGSDAAQSCLDQGRDLPVSRAADGVGVACGQAWPKARLAWQPGAGGAGFSSNVVPALLLKRRFPQQRRLPAVARAAAPGLRSC